MARYDFACDPCRYVWEISVAMDDIGAHVESCPQCGEPARRVFSRGMIKVRDGTAPTRFSTGAYKRTVMARDDGFQKEFNSIWNDGGAPEHPGTKERYEIFDDTGSTGSYTALPSQRESFKQGQARAQEHGSYPSQAKQDAARHQFHQNSLDRSAKKLRGLSASQKGKRT